MRKESASVASQTLKTQAKIFPEAEPTSESTDYEELESDAQKLPPDVTNEHLLVHQKRGKNLRNK